MRPLIKFFEITEGPQDGPYDYSPTSAYDIDDSMYDSEITRYVDVDDVEWDIEDAALEAGVDFSSGLEDARGNSVFRLVGPRHSVQTLIRRFAHDVGLAGTIVTGPIYSSNDGVGRVESDRPVDMGRND